MQKCVIIYSSTDGHTQKISEKMSEIIACKYATDVVSVSNARFLNLSQYALIVLGASIRYGKHSKDIYNFINSNQIVLEKTNNAFFWKSCQISLRWGEMAIYDFSLVGKGGRGRGVGGEGG